MEQRIFGQLPDETWVYPGHGDDTTLGVDRGNLGEMARAGLVTPRPTGAAGSIAGAAVVDQRAQAGACRSVLSARAPGAA